MVAKRQPIIGRDRVILREAIPLHCPISLIILTGDICNFRCKYCYQSLDDSLKKDIRFVDKFLSYETFLIFANQLKDFKEEIKSVTFTGYGEPLLNKDLPKIIKYLKSNNLVQRTEVITNASLLNNNLSLDLINAGLDCLKVSIQGITSDRYKDICGVSIDIERLISNLDFFYKNKGKCEVRIKTVNIALEEDEVEKFYRMFEKVADSIFIEEIIDVSEKIDFTDMVKSDGSQNTVEIKCCPQLFFTLALSPDGEIYPCCSFDYKESFGNIKNSTLKEIWNGDLRKQLILSHLNKQRHQVKYCNKCYLMPRLNKDEDLLDDYTEEILERFK